MGKNRRKKYKSEKVELTLPAAILTTLFMFVDVMPRPFEGKTHYFKRVWGGNLSYKLYWQALKRLEERGWIKIFKEKESEFVKLTKNGKLQALLVKAKMEQPKKWDGKWRLIIYDIPEDSREQRHLFRKLLKHNGFYKLQASVFVSPYPLNSQAISYLKETGLDSYIRICRIDELDDDVDLKKYFNLN